MQPDHSSLGSSQSMIERLFGCEVKTHTCCQCGLKTERTSTELLFSLCYPHTAGECSNRLCGDGVGFVHVWLTRLSFCSIGSSHKKHTFGTILEYSICKHQQSPAWCEKCGKYMATVSM